MSVLPEVLILMVVISHVTPPFYSVAMHGTVGITGLSLESFKNNWGSAYQMTNNAGIPDPNGDIYWNFK